MKINHSTDSIRSWLGGCDEATAPSTLLSRASVPIARREPICLELYDNNPIADPPMMGCYFGREPSDLEAPIDWREELKQLSGLHGLKSTSHTGSDGGAT